MKIDAEMIETARKVERALDAALKVAESEAVNLNELPEVPDVQIQLAPMVKPSADVAQATAESAAARKEYTRETEVARAVALSVGVAAEIGRVLLPNISVLLKLMPIVLLSLAIFATAGCRADVRPGAVQVGPTSRPAIEIDRGAVEAPVAVNAPIEAQVKVDVPIAAPVWLDSLVKHGDVTSQPAATDAEARQEAARDARQTAVTVNLSGSAWPIVAVVAVVIGGIAAVFYLRAQLKASEARRDAQQREVMAAQSIDRAAAEYGTLEGNALAVAKSISTLPPGPERDALLTMIGARLPDRAQWDALLERKDLRVHRSTDVVEA